jgi:putative transposase
MLSEEYEELRKRYWRQHLWARGYFSATVGSVTKEMIQENITNQFKREEEKNNFKVEEDEFQSQSLQESFSEWQIWSVNYGIPRLCMNCFKLLFIFIENKVLFS